MRNRFLRIILFFDLPVETASQRKAYAFFRKKLITNGFIMLQKSVYTKLVINRKSMELEINKVKTILPKEGLVQILTVTEKQFSRIETILGTAIVHSEISSTSRLVII